MLPKGEKLLRPAGRGMERLVGCVCAVISIAFTALVAFLVYVMAWVHRNQNGLDELTKGTTMALLGLFLFIALVFSFFASRLLRREQGNGRLMTPRVLEAWAGFYTLVTLMMCADSLLKRQWRDLVSHGHMLLTTLSMSAASFMLARRWRQQDRTRRGNK
jgi:uncharacterized membrane protein